MSNTAVIVAAVRTPCGRALKGSLARVRPEDLAATAIAGVLAAAKVLKGSDIEDVIFGCAMPEAEQGMNVARIATLLAGLPPCLFLWGGLTITSFIFLNFKGFFPTHNAS